MMQVIPVAPPTDPVAFKKTAMNGKPVGEFKAASASPTQKQNVISMTKPVIPFKTRVQAMPNGKTRDASLISSAEKDIMVNDEYQKRNQ